MDVVRGSDRLRQAQTLADARGAELQVVSRWAGETEASLRSLFVTAEASGAVLFFDDADELFGAGGSTGSLDLVRIASDYPHAAFVVGVADSRPRRRWWRRWRR